MKLKQIFMYGICIGLTLPAAAMAKENKVDTSAQNTLHLSIYNSNLAFVSDSREISLEKGLNQIAFAGVSSSLLPETAMLQGNGIEVLEQNYNYNLINPQNILQNSVGQKVKTALYDEKTGETKYDEALILDAGDSHPVLAFSYGIETAFPGRIIYKEIPSGLRNEPTLVIDVRAQQQGQQDLTLDYMTRGLSWKADYVADVITDEYIKLKSFVSLTNESGIDYKDASIQLISGNVRNFTNYAPQAPMMRAAKTVSYDSAAGLNAESAVSQESFSDYYLYTLPEKTTLLNKQNKQVSLIDKNNVRYTKEYRSNSPIYLSYSARNYGKYEKAHPQIVYKLENKAENGLGTPLPTGTIRFFAKDSQDRQQFIGEARLPMLPVNEKAELTIGTASDITIDGKIDEIKAISKDKLIATVAHTFKNAKTEDVEIEFTQNFASNTEWKITKENLKGEKKNSSEQNWLVKIPASGETTLTYEVTLTNVNAQSSLR